MRIVIRTIFIKPHHPPLNHSANTVFLHRTMLIWSDRHHFIPYLTIGNTIESPFYRPKKGFSTVAPLRWLCYTHCLLRETSHYTLYIGRSSHTDYIHCIYTHSHSLTVYTVESQIEDSVYTLGPAAWYLYSTYIHDAPYTVYTSCALHRWLCSRLSWTYIHRRSSRALYKLHSRFTRRKAVERRACTVLSLAATVLGEGPAAKKEVFGNRPRC